MKHKAFTMLELIFVIVILGVVASIGSSIIAQTFEGYLTQRAVHSASIKTELAINQLANRLLYRINGSELARVPGTTNFLAANALNLRNVLPANNTHRALLWINYERDGFRATNFPAWSGMVDLDASNFTTLTTTASRLRNDAVNTPSEQTILDNLDAAGNNNGDPLAAIKFIEDPLQKGYRNAAGTIHKYDALCMHQTVSANSCMFAVNINTDTTLTFTVWGDRVAGQMIYTEFYQLAASAYAVVPEPIGAVGTIGGRLLGNTGVRVWDLRLYYDYQPWQRENYAAGANSLLLRNVTVFRFKQEGNTIRLKLCVAEQISDTSTVSICKEKAVIR